MVWLFQSWCFLTSFPIAMSGVTRLLVFHLYTERHWRNKSQTRRCSKGSLILSCPPKQIFLPSPKAASLPHLLLQPLPGLEDLSLSFFKLCALSPDKCACLCENYPLDIEIAGKEKPLSAGFPAAFQFSTPPPLVLWWVFLTAPSLYHTPNLSRVSLVLFRCCCFTVFSYHFNFLLSTTFWIPLCPPFLEGLFYEHCFLLHVTLLPVHWCSVMMVLVYIDWLSILNNCFSSITANLFSVTLFLLQPLINVWPLGKKGVSTFISPWQHGEELSPVWSLQPQMLSTPWRKRESTVGIICVLSARICQWCCVAAIS